MCVEIRSSSVQSCREDVCDVVEPAQHPYAGVGEGCPLACLLGVWVASCEVVAVVADGFCGFYWAVGSGVVVAVVQEARTP